MGEEGCDGLGLCGGRCQCEAFGWALGARVLRGGNGFGDWLRHGLLVTEEVTRLEVREFGSKADGGGGNQIILSLRRSFCYISFCFFLMMLPMNRRVEDVVCNFMD